MRGERPAVRVARLQDDRQARAAHVPRDWMRLPKRRRDAIWLHYVPGQTAVTCSPEYRDALHEVLAFARQANAEAAEREAEMGRRQGELF